MKYIFLLALFITNSFSVIYTQPIENCYCNEDSEFAVKVFDSETTRTDVKADNTNGQSFFTCSESSADGSDYSFYTANWTYTSNYDSTRNYYTYVETKFKCEVSDTPVCFDGGPSFQTVFGSAPHCDRTCEQVGMITNENDLCVTDLPVDPDYTSFCTNFLSDCSSNCEFGVQSASCIVDTGNIDGPCVCNTEPIDPDVVVDNNYDDILNEINDNLVSFSSKYQDNSTSISSLDNKVGDIKGSLLNIDTNSEDAVNALENLENTFSEKLSELNTNITSNNTDNDNSTMETELNSVNTSLSGIRSDINSNNTEISSKLDTSNSIGSGISEDVSSLKDSLVGDGTSDELDDIIEPGFFESLLGEYEEFYDSMSDHFTTFDYKVIEAKDLISEGLTLNLSNNNITTCPFTEDLDFSSFGLSNYPFSVDFCKHTSYLKPYLYPFFMLMINFFMVGFAFNTLRSL